MVVSQTWTWSSLFGVQWPLAQIDCCPEPSAAIMPAKSLLLVSIGKFSSKTPKEQFLAGVRSSAVSLGEDSPFLHPCRLSAR
jgi:hypothetical protein